jgi:hypothetical protein
MAPASRRAPKANAQLFTRVPGHISRGASEITSACERSLQQNARLVDEKKLDAITTGIHQTTWETADEYGNPGN